MFNAKLHDAIVAVRSETLFIGFAEIITDSRSFTKLREASRSSRNRYSTLCDANFYTPKDLLYRLRLEAAIERSVHRASILLCAKVKVRGDSTAKLYENFAIVFVAVSIASLTTERNTCAYGLGLALVLVLALDTRSVRFDIFSGRVDPVCRVGRPTSGLMS